MRLWQSLLSTLTLDSVTQLQVWQTCTPGCHVTTGSTVTQWVCSAGKSELSYLVSINPYLSTEEGNRIASVVLVHRLPIPPRLYNLDHSGKTTLLCLLYTQDGQVGDIVKTLVLQMDQKEYKITLCQAQPSQGKWRQISTVGRGVDDWTFISVQLYIFPPTKKINIWYLNAVISPPWWALKSTRSG